MAGSRLPPLPDTLNVDGLRLLNLPVNHVKRLDLKDYLLRLLTVQRRFLFVFLDGTK